MNFSTGKIYETPTIDVLLIYEEDVVRTSVEQGVDGDSLNDWWANNG